MSSMADSSPEEREQFLHKDASDGKPPSRVPSSASQRGSVRIQEGGVYIKRVSSTPSCDRPFERTPSQISSVPSGKSIASSVRTRLASVSKSEYHADLKGTLKAGLTLNLLAGAFIILFGSSLLFGYNIGCLNAISDQIQEFYNQTYMERSGEPVNKWTMSVLWSFTTAIYLPGGMAGAFSAGFLADRFGRKRTILFSHIFAFVASILAAVCQVAGSPELLMVSRLIQGINCGLGGTIAPMYLSEITPFNLRGAFGTTHQLFITIGIFISSIFGLRSILGAQDRWPYVLMLNAFPALISLLILPFLPESPRFLLLCKNQRDEAMKALQFYRGQEDVSVDMEEMDTEHQQQLKTETFTLKDLAFTRELRMPLFIACFLQVVQQFSGINAIFFYSNDIFKAANVDIAHIPYAIIGTNGVNVLMTVISVPLMDIAGRRPLLLIPMIGMIVDLGLITVAQNLTHISGMQYLSVACVIIYVICFAVGLGPIPLMIGAEMFRQGPRPKAMAIAGVFNWVCTFIIAMSFVPIQKVLGAYVFLVFLVLMLGFIIFVYKMVPETKNKTFEEIAHTFAPGGDVEVEEMLDEDEDVFDAIPVSNDDGEDHRLVTIDLSNRPAETSSPEGIEMKIIPDNNDDDEKNDEKAPLKESES